MARRNRTPETDLTWNHDMWLRHMSTPPLGSFDAAAQRRNEEVDKLLAGPRPAIPELSELVAGLEQGGPERVAKWLVPQSKPKKTPEPGPYFYLPPSLLDNSDYIISADPAEAQS